MIPVQVNNAMVNAVEYLVMTAEDSLDIQRLKLVTADLDRW